jgi:hypothetical protein
MRIGTDKLATLVELHSLLLLVLGHCRTRLVTAHIERNDAAVFFQIGKRGFDALIGFEECDSCTHFAQKSVSGTLYVVQNKTVKTQNVVPDCREVSCHLLALESGVLLDLLDNNLEHVQPLTLSP